MYCRNIQQCFYPEGGLLISPRSTQVNTTRYLGDLQGDETNLSENLEMHHRGNTQVYLDISAKSRFTIWTLRTVKLYCSSFLQVSHKLKVVQIYNTCKDPYFIWFIFLDMFYQNSKMWVFFIPIIIKNFVEMRLSPQIIYKNIR